MGAYAVQIIKEIQNLEGPACCFSMIESFGKNLLILSIIRPGIETLADLWAHIEVGGKQVMARKHNER